MIKLLLFDIDNTLIDFSASARIAMEKAFARRALPFSEWMYDVFRTVNAELWQKIEKGMLSREEMHRTRWSYIFPKLGIDYDSVAFEYDFMEMLDETAVEIPHAREVLEALSGRYLLCAASNASHCQQRTRLTLAGMLPYFTHVFASEEIGAPKPTRAFFDACFAAYPDISPDEAMIIGDSLTADIGGGIEYGLHTCWFCPNGEAIPKEMPIEYTIHSLPELLQIL